MEPNTRDRPALRLVRSTDHSQLSSEQPGWGDPQVQKAIQLMHARPEAPWTVTSLARSVGLSRPAFARRFVASTGISPGRYLTGYRMQLARELLRRPELSLAAVAERVGYSSEFAFNRAFKRHHHVAPGSFRRQAGWSSRYETRMAA